MTDASYTHISIIADRSGSMSALADPPETRAQAATRGIHKLITDQRAQPGRVTFSLTDFDTTRTVVEDFGDGSKALAWACIPSGATALLDAAGMAIAATGASLAAMPEDQRPANVIFVIATDGHENSSREYKLDDVKAMITEQTGKYGWSFVYIGAEIDAFDSGATMGMSAGSTMPTSSAGLYATYNATSSAISRTRSATASTGLASPVSYSDEERQQVWEAGKPKP